MNWKAHRSAFKATLLMLLLPSGCIAAPLIPEDYQMLAFLSVMGLAMAGILGFFYYMNYRWAVRDQEFRDLYGQESQPRR